MKLDVLSVAERNDTLRGRTSMENVTQVWRTRHFRGILFYLFIFLGLNYFFFFLLLFKKIPIQILTLSPSLSSLLLPPQTLPLLLQP